MADHNLRGKVVVITGASSGFGKGAALQFGSRGASVVLAARRDALLEDIAVVVETIGGKALVVHTDVSHREEVENLAEATVGKFGCIDVWVNNAGGAALG